MVKDPLFEFEVGCTHEKSYGPIPDTFMSLSTFSAVSISGANSDKEDEVVMRDWIENLRPVWRRTIRSETTQAKAGSLPQPSAPSRNKKNIPLSSLMESKKLPTTHQRLLLSRRPLNSLGIPTWHRWAASSQFNFRQGAICHAIHFIKKLNFFCINLNSKIMV